jgi:hypothetical protein
LAGFLFADGGKKTPSKEVGVCRMKLTALAMAVAATVAFGHSAQARVHHRSHPHGDHFYRRETRHRVFVRYRLARRHERRWMADGENNAWRESWGGSRRDAWHTRHSASLGPRPSAWCGWEMRQLVGSDPGPAYNLARNWALWGHGGPAGVGAVVVWPHHVGRIVGRQGGQWVIESGNDGHRLRTRPRSIAGAIAFRWG